MEGRNFFDEFDMAADRACEAIKARARHFVLRGAVDDIEDIPDLIEVKDALCSALRMEVNQWRRHRDVASPGEQYFMRY
jgi:hypothetical protein